MVKGSVDEITKSLFLLVFSLVIILQLAECQILLGDPCSGSANYDGTDISRPYIYDNSTGTPVYTYVDQEGYHPPSHTKRAATAYRNRLWPLGIVPYSLDSSFSAIEREKVLDGMRHWEENTCIRFHPVPIPNMYLYSGGVYFFRGSGCCSTVGKFYGYIQRVSIASFCSFATVVHEIGHVLGFWHEQSRPDRDEYITVHEENIRPGYHSDFQKIYSINSLGVPYDYNSIMHYSQTAFANSGTITISTKEDDIPFGKAPELSRLDIIQTELLYKDQCKSRVSSVSRLPVKVPVPSPVNLPPGACNKHLLGRRGQIYPPDSPYKSNTSCIWIIEIPEGYYIQLEIYDLELDTPCLDDVGNYIVVYPGYNEGGGSSKLCGSISYRKFYITGLYAYIKFHTNSEVNGERLKGFSKVEFTAQDINECNSNYCDHSCENIPGSYKCSCKEGYYLAGTRRCFDINECGYSNGNCSHKCVNMAGTYRCECPADYTLLSNKRDCFKGELPCQRNNGGCRHICTDTLNGPVCSCRKGYVLFAASYCADINECTLYKDICGNSVCFNVPGHYLCICRLGYQQSANSCEDIDECSNGVDPCGVNQRCINTPGSYHCECDTGYTNTSEGCVDINECLFNNGGCDHICVNTNGSLQCLCNTSYVLAADNKTCISGCKSYTIVQEPSGNISTTGYPALLYASGSNCTWVIDLPVKYNSVELRFDEMSIEESPNCMKDRLTILNGKDNDAISMGSYCGSRSPFIMRSSTGSITIQFVSDDVQNRKGFSLQYRGLTERPQGVYECDIKLKETTTFALATFPLKYTDPMECMYSLRAPLKGYKVKLTFLYLDIQSANCSQDRIELYNGRSLTPKKKLADICNGTHATEFISRGRQMRMKYVGKSLHKYRGFHASLLFV